MGVATSTMPPADQARKFSVMPLIKWAALLTVVGLNGLAVVTMYASGEYGFALLTVFLVATGVYIYTNPKTYSHRYVFPAIAAMVAFTIFPLVYTVWMAFTNYSGTNLLTIERVQAYHLQQKYAVAGSSYSAAMYDNGDGTFQFVLNAESSDELLISEPVELLPEADFIAGQAAGKEMTLRISTSPIDAAPEQKPAPIRLLARDYRSHVNNLQIVSPAGLELVKDGLRKFAPKRPLFKLEADDLLVNQKTGERFLPNWDQGDKDREFGYYFLIDDNGQFIANEDGRLQGKLAPGFITQVGWHNFVKIITDKSVQGPFLQIFIWTVVFAFLTVFLTLAVGMLLASLVQWEELKGRALYRVLLILPYAVPAFLSILVFKGLFNQNFGEINALLEFLGFDRSTLRWFTDPLMAKAMIIIVNTWLGYPYMMILCMGMLKAIPEDLYEASAMDGAGPIQNFFKITLPLIFKPMIPLLIASFAFNFNNFVLIQLLTNGRPDILGSNPSAGTTDILVSYTYRIAFEAGGSTDYGLAGAIATLIFLMVGAMAVLNLKMTKTKI